MLLHTAAGMAPTMPILEEAGTLHRTADVPSGDSDGNGASAELQHPLGIHYTEGALFIADSYNHKIRVLDLSNLDVHTVEASVDIICTDKSCSRIWEPSDVILLEKNLYVSDTNNHRILKIDLDTETTEIFVN